MAALKTLLAPDETRWIFWLYVIIRPFPGCYVPARVLGYLEMTDGGKPDYKLISVVDCDPRLLKLSGTERTSISS